MTGGPVPLRRCVGLDLSLTSTGMSDGFVHEAVTTSPGMATEGRLDHIVRHVMRFMLRAGGYPDLVAVEGPSYGSRTPGQDELSALRYMVRHRLWRADVPFAVVPPSTLKRYVTGHGRASKQEMAAALDSAYAAGLSGVKVSHGRYDRADALGLASMAYERLGSPLPRHSGGGEALATARRASMLAVAWPELISD